MDHPVARRRSHLVTRRQVVGGAFAGAALVALGACGTGSSSADDESGSTAKRVVALGQGADADALIALGIIPVGISKANSGTDVAAWTKAALGPNRVAILDTTESTPYEQVAKLRPTLIAATSYYNLPASNAKLADIATVVGPAARANQETWQQTTVAVGTAVGRRSAARRLVAQTQAKIDRVREDHPVWAGKTFTFGPATGGELFTVKSTQDVAAGLLQQLGLRLSPKVTTLPTSSTPGRAVVSLERLDLIDADVIMLTYFDDDLRKSIEDSRLFRQLPAVRRGAYVNVAPAVAVGLAFPSVLSIPYCLDRIVPHLERALGR